MVGRRQLFGEPEVWVRDVVFTAAVALTVSFLGPYGSYDQPLQDRIVRSFAYGFLSGIWIWPLMRLVLRLGVRAGLPELFTMVAGLTLVTVPITGLVWLIGRALKPHDPSPTLLALYFGVLAMSLPIGVAYLLADRQLARAKAPPRPPDPPRLYARLPPHLGREVLALQAEDHYVRVHTKAGSALILMRLADAIAELDGLHGLRVHRSWWVAKDGVKAARAEGRRAALTLANGVEAPVTRDAVPLIRRAGWL